jgi:predicted nuclease with TOPRIM domain
LRDLSEQLEVVEAENPRLQMRLARLSREESELEERLRENQPLINARLRENEILRVQQDSFILQARTTGKVCQYVETASNADGGSALKTTIDTARARVAALERELDVEDTREKLNAFLNIIGRLHDGVFPGARS